MAGKKLRIAQVGGLWEEIPPPKYGGSERVISYLTEQLVAQGHDVTLFACGTSKTRAKLVSVYPRPLFRDGIPWTNITYPLLNLTAALDREKDFDILHVHIATATDYMAFPLLFPIKNKVVFTLHLYYPPRPKYEDRHLVLQKYKQSNFISISEAQRQDEETLNWVATVHNGIDPSIYHFNAQPKNHVVWIGNFKPYKGAKDAILAARQAGLQILLASKIDLLDAESKQYYENEVLPLIDNKNVVYVGELSDAEKNTFFGDALAFLHPIQFNDPFGLVMVESMACGTPVISFRAGGAPEIIADGQTGFLVNTVEEMVKRIQDVSKIDRRACRERVEKLFTADTMTKNYLKVYERILKLPV